MFSCEFCQIFKNIFWQNTSGWLLLEKILRNTCFIEYLWEIAEASTGGVL